MNENGSRKSRGPLFNGIVIAAFTVIFYTVLQKPEIHKGIFGDLWAIFSPVVLGLCIAFVLNVAMIYIEKGMKFITKGKIRPGIMRTVSILMTIILMLGFVSFVLGVIIPAMSDTIAQIISYIPQSEADLTKWMNDNLSAFGLSKDNIITITNKMFDLIDQMLAFIRQEYMEIVNIALSATGSVLDVAMDFIISMIFAIYILASKEKIGIFTRATLRRFTKPAFSGRVLDICHLSYDSFTSFVKGQLLEACILGTLCFIGMLIFRFPYAGVVSLLIGVTALIPIFGAFIGAGIAALLIVIVSPIKALFFIIYILVLQQLEGNLIYPRVVGQSMGLPGIIVLAAVTVGGNIAGIPGMLIGVPLCAVLYTLLKQAVFGKKDVPETK